MRYNKPMEVMNVQEVYADLYFLVNACMDLLCLLISAAVLHRRILRRRAILGAVVGGMYALTTLLLGIGGVLGIALDLLAAVGITATVFWQRRMRFSLLLRLSATFALVSALLGGIMTVLYTAINRLGLPFSALQGEGLSVWMFAILAILSGALTLRGGRFFGRSHRTKSVTLEIELMGKRAVLCAMVDSGNLLRDPVSGRSVIVADREKLRALLPDGLEGDAWMQNAELARRVRLIPTATATGNGMLRAFLPDRLTVTDGQERYASNDLIALTALGGRAQGFDALISLD